jgi:hypothetical protein
MSQPTIGRQRLASQWIAASPARSPGEVVRHLGAVQAQDYLGALWAVALRAPGVAEQDVERALSERRIVRTWPMRGTIHFVAPEDVRWMLALLAPRVVQRSQGRLRQLGLDAATLRASETAVARSLEGGKQLTRPALYALLEAAGIATGGQRGIHILGQLAHAGLICFGAREGKQPTFTLLDEWVPAAAPRPRDEALAALALRYFTGHGPATLQDFIWWAGLTVADARAGLGAVAEQLVQMQVAGLAYYGGGDETSGAPEEGRAFLLPPFDEFLVAYRDRSASLDPAYNTLIVPGGNGIFNPIAVIDGRVVGTWKRMLRPGEVVISFSPFVPLPERQLAALRDAVEPYSRFLGLPALVSVP